MYSWRDKEWSKIAHTECLMKRNEKHYWNSEQGERKQEGGCVSVWLKSYSRSPYWQTVRYCELVLLLYLRVYYLFFFSFLAILPNLWDLGSLPGIERRLREWKCRILSTGSPGNLESLLLLSEKATAPHSSTLAWKIPWAEEPGGLQSMGSWRVRHDWATSLSLFTFMHWRRKWQPTPVFLPGESQAWRSLVGCRLWGRTELDTTEAT